MAVNLSPVYVDGQLINGIPANGAKLFTYATGSTTKLTTYQDLAGLVPHANPIILNSRGEPANGGGVSQPIFLTGGLTYDFVFAPSADTDPPTAPIRTIIGIKGINDTTTTTTDQWITSSVTPTYVNQSSFTLPGDQTIAFSVGRRLKITETAGTVYGSVVSSAYTSLTTVTIKLDFGILDSGLSNIFLGIITPINNALPRSLNYGLNQGRGSIVMDAAVMDLWSLPNTIDGIGSSVTINSILNAPQAGARRTLYPIAGTVITNNAMFSVDGGINYTTFSSDSLEFEAITTSTYNVHIIKKDPSPQSSQLFTIGIQRLQGTTYFNTSNKMIIVLVVGSGASSSLSISVNGVTVDQANNNGTGAFTKVIGFVPNGANYTVAISGTGSIWMEYR